MSQKEDDLGRSCSSSEPFGQLDYRASVLGVFINDLRQVLVLERIDTPGAWQFPQGGIEGRETPLEALHREMYEELGCAGIEVLAVSKNTITYDFPPDLNVPICRHYKGQKAWWYLCRFSDGSSPHLDQAVDQEFTPYRWISPGDSPSLVVLWKRDAYVQGLRALGLLAPR